MNIRNPKQQRGTTMLFTLVFLVGFVAAIGWGTDTGNLVVNKTRLQNALDAAALSAATTLLNDIDRDTATATAGGRATFDLFKAAPGNQGLSGVDASALTFEYSRTLRPWAAGSAPPAFVRVSTNALNVSPILLQVVGVGDYDVGAVSTAGIVGQNCNLTPFVLCSDMDPLDENCDDDTNGDGNPDCYGYEVGQITDLVVACQGNTSGCDPETELEAGNFNLLNLDDLQGGRDIRDALSDEERLGVNICAGGNTDTLNTKPGYTWGNIKQGIDGRFDSDTNTTVYDVPAFQQYKSSGTGNARREMAAPIGDCRGLQNGNTDLPWVTTACLFLTDKAQQGPGSIKKIVAEFTGELCLQQGSFNPSNPVFNGPAKVVLFKSEGSGDS